MLLTLGVLLGDRAHTTIVFPFGPFDVQPSRRETFESPGVRGGPCRIAFTSWVSLWPRSSQRSPRSYGLEDRVENTTELCQAGDDLCGCRLGTPSSRPAIETTSVQRVTARPRLLGSGNLEDRRGSYRQPRSGTRSPFTTMIPAFYARNRRDRHEFEVDACGPWFVVNDVHPRGSGPSCHACRTRCCHVLEEV